MLRSLERLRELAVAERGQALPTRAKIIIAICKVGFFADEADREIAGAPALADARVEDGSLPAGFLSDDQQRVRLFDPGNGRVEQVRRTTPFRIDRRAILTRIDIGTP